jgi:hypothetical protein
MIREKGQWEGLPGHWINGQRWVATETGWHKIRHRLAEQADLRCEKCGDKIYYRGDAHHRYGRAAGKRDDRIELPNGTRNLFYLCRQCHSETPIERKSQLDN